MKDLITDAKTTFGDEYDEEHARPLKVIFSQQKNLKRKGNISEWGSRITEQNNNIE